MAIEVQLPDGSSRHYEQAVTALKVAEDISPRLASATLAAVVDGRMCDVNSELTESVCQLRLITNRDDEALEILRHTAAHVLADAVVRLYGKDVQYTIGPALVDDFQYGFYYDFDLPDSISADDLPKIEQEMAKIIAEKVPLQREVLDLDKAKTLLKDLGQDYKIEMIDDLVRDENIQAVSFYRQGDFIDMCRGPHLPNTGKVKAFKLLSVAGAYWRGDENKKMLTRIYGVAFFDKKELAAHIDRIAEAKRRDHRIINKDLNLFVINDTVGPGLPMWTPAGSIVRMELQNWLQNELIRQGYQIVFTPHIGKLDLYRTSGHYPYYKDSQFPPIEMGEETGYLLRPMNCPHHLQIYKATQHSYRELPIRLAEFGAVYRMEQTGQLNGLIRVRGFTQDDAHIICTTEQLEAEIESCIELVKLVLGTLGLDTYRVRIGLRDPDSDKYTGDSANWDLAENNIRAVVRKMDLPFTEEQGEAAFYGPKIDFVVTDCIGREWQLGTIQVDYNLPERFELEYIGADNTAHRPVMIHRAPFGSLERFIGILIEHFAGAFPLWLSPKQVAVLPVSDKYNEYAASVAARLSQDYVRVEVDDTAEKIGAKIRKATLAKTPYMLIVGQREVDSQNVSVRHRTDGDAGVMNLEDFAAALGTEIKTKGAQRIVVATTS